jgi:hypothetical protein
MILGVLATMFAAWAGLVVGVSFLSTRAKFLAPSITLKVALDVGRQTFRILCRTDMLFAATASVLCIVKPNPTTVLGLMAIWCVILTERFWLLPVLDLRAGIHLAGLKPAPSYHHVLFARLEAMKAVLLFICSATAIVRLANDMRGVL